MAISYYFLGNKKIKVLFFAAVSDVAVITPTTTATATATATATTTVTHLMEHQYTYLGPQ